MIKIFVFALMLFVSYSWADDNTPPLWMYNLNSSNEMTVGYGEGQSMQEAKANARSEIAHSIKVRLSEKYNKSEQLQNDDYSKDIKREIAEEVDVELTGLATLKSEKKEGIYYIALEFDGRSLRKKIKSCFSPDKKFKMMASSNPYKHTFFAKELKDIFPHLSSVPDFDVVYTNGTYKFLLDDQEFYLGQDDIEKFLFVYNEPSFSVRLLEHTDQGYKQSTRLKEGSYFHLDIKLSDRGYLTLLSIDEEGKVCMLFDNEQVTAKQTKTYPNLELYEGLRTEIISRDNSAVESYMAILCEDPQSYTHFEEITESINTNRKSLRFPRLYTDIKSCKYTSVVLKTNR